jgi:hypothetical protein
MEHLLVCGCGEVMVKSSNGTTKVRAKIFIFREGKAYGVCKGCDREVLAPVRLNQGEVADLLAKSRNPRLFIKGSK